jgi:hypothetical protein
MHACLGLYNRCAANLIGVSRAIVLLRGFACAATYAQITEWSEAETALISPSTGIGENSYNFGSPLVLWHCFGIGVCSKRKKPPKLPTWR